MISYIGVLIKGIERDKREMALTREHVIQLFDDIEENDHLYRVRFYETNSALIFSLDEAQQHYFNFYYISSLFELGKYDHVLAEIDPLIEYVFLQNVSIGYGDTYEALLMKKASALHNTFRYKESLDLAEQLIGINPYQPLYQSLARRARRANFHWNTSWLRLATIIAILTTAAGSAIFWFTQFNSSGHSMFTSFLIVICPCLVSIFLLGSSYLFAQLRSSHQVSNLVAAKKKEKRALREKL